MIDRQRIHQNRVTQELIDYAVNRAYDEQQAQQWALQQRCLDYALAALDRKILIEKAVEKAHADWQKKQATRKSAERKQKYAAISRKAVDRAFMIQQAVDRAYATHARKSIDPVVDFEANALATRKRYDAAVKAGIKDMQPQRGTGKLAARIIKF